jgi:putative ABC transport system permease protein
MIKDYFWLAIKNLRRRGIRSWLTLLGIVIGIAAVVSLISVGDGLKIAVNAQFGVSTTEALTVQAGGLSGYGPPGSGVVNPLTTEDADAIEKLNSVEVAIPRNIETVKIEFNNKELIGYAASIIEGEKRHYIYDIVDIEAEYGRLLKDGDSNKVVLGTGFLNADKNGFNKEVQVGNKIKIQGKDFEVVGILKKKGSFILDNVVLMDDTPLRNLMKTGDTVDIIAVKVKSKDLMDQAKQDIEKLMRQRRHVKEGEEDFEVSTPQAMLATVNSILNGVQAFIVLIAFASIIVGALGIVNTMTTSVLERKKEIGVMKAIGAKNSDVFLQFLIESGLLGLVGGIIGVTVGIVLGAVGMLAISNFIGANPSFKIDFMLVFSALFGGFLIGAIAGIAPAMNAAKQNPVDALRG